MRYEGACHTNFCLLTLLVVLGQQLVYRRATGGVVDHPKQYAQLEAYPYQQQPV